MRSPFNIYSMGYVKVGTSEGYAATAASCSWGQMKITPPQVRDFPGISDKSLLETNDRIKILPFTILVDFVNQMTELFFIVKASDIIRCYQNSSVATNLRIPRAWVLLHVATSH